MKIESLNRRVDVLVFVKGTMNPMLLIECKAKIWDEKAKQQLLGYNFWIAAPFFAMAGGDRIETFWREEGKIASVPFLPKYEDLLKA